METHLPTPMTGRVELLIYQRVSLIGKTFVNSPRLNHQISRKNPEHWYHPRTGKSVTHRTFIKLYMVKICQNVHQVRSFTIKSPWSSCDSSNYIWSKYGQNMVNMFHKHYQKLIVSWGTHHHPSTPHPRSASSHQAGGPTHLGDLGRWEKQSWWFWPFLDKAMVNHVMWSNFTTTSWKLSLSSCQSLNWQTWTWRVEMTGRWFGHEAIIHPQIP